MFTFIQYRTYDICPGPVFQREFNGGVRFAIRLTIFGNGGVCCMIGVTIYGNPDKYASVIYHLEPFFNVNSMVMSIV